MGGRGWRWEGERGWWWEGGRGWRWLAVRIEVSDRGRHGEQGMLGCSRRAKVRRGVCVGGRCGGYDGWATDVRACSAPPALSARRVQGDIILSTLLASLGEWRPQYTCLNHFRKSPSLRSLIPISLPLSMCLFQALSLSFCHPERSCHSLFQ